MTTQRTFVITQDAALATALGRALGVAPERSIRGGPAAGDFVLLDAAGGGDATRGNAFSLCRALKREPRVRVFVVLRAEDPYGEEIARFCMADGVVHADPNGGVTGIDRIAVSGGPARTRPPVDALLERIEERLQADPGRAATALQRIVAEVDSGSVTTRFTDQETGLYDGAFAGFKLDEELKRAVRFHQALALLLLDCGIEAWPKDDALRQTVLAEVAGVFLEECRDIDVLARFTPTVFLFLLPGTGPDGATVVARRMVDSLSRREFTGRVVLRPAVGIATVPHPAVTDRKGFVARAERALVAALAGADRVQVAVSD
ncbi:MAG: GGDEF domain-containing protein [Planctomycetes bacterium]|nr:GGDEF domain-containing protein [Planctomycetota bacterium]